MEKNKTLNVNGIDAYYGKAHILQNMSINVKRGEKVIILGRNGMGKSTLLKAIMGIGGLKTRGEITYNNIAINGKATSNIAKTGIGYVPQGWLLFRSLTVEEHLIMAYKAAKGNYEWTPERVFDTFPELASRKKISGTSLSGGEQQILAISRALVTNSDLILMDEPSEGISVRVLDRVIDICDELTQNNKSILLVEQNLDLAMKIADRVYILVNGTIVHETTVNDFKDDKEKHKLYLGI